MCPQVSVLSRACSNFLIGTMDLSNCLSLLSLAEAYGSASLLQSANQFVVQNFFDLSKTQEFLDIQVLLKKRQDEEGNLEYIRMNVDSLLPVFGHSH